MSFNLNDAPEKSTNSGTQYQRPGIAENVKITEAVLLQTQANNVDYMELRTVSGDGAVGKSSKMFLSTETKPGKKMSAWSVTSRNIVDLIMATHNVDEQTAKGMLNVSSKEEVVSKVATLLVGRPFRGKFKGEESSNGKTYASLDTVESMQVPTDQSRLKFDPSRDIKKYVPYTANAAEAVNAGSDLPF